MAPANGSSEDPYDFCGENGENIWTNFGAMKKGSERCSKAESDTLPVWALALPYKDLSKGKFWVLSSAYSAVLVHPAAYLLAPPGSLMSDHEYLVWQGPFQVDMGILSGPITILTEDACLVGLPEILTVAQTACLCRL